MEDYVNGLVSIVMPAYNAEKTIVASIESVLAQDYPNWELLVVNDCSTDSTMMVSEKFAAVDPRIKILNLDSNVGISEARNTAIRNATGRYLAFLDSDDVWKANKLSRQLEFMINRGYAFTFTDYELMDSHGKLLGKTIYSLDSLDYKKLLKKNFIGCLTVMIDRKRKLEVKMPSIRHEDYAAWLNILKEGINAYGLNESLAIYRISHNSTSADKIRSIAWLWKIYRENQEFGRLKSAYLVLLNTMKLIGRYQKAGILRNVVKR